MRMAAVQRTLPGGERVAALWLHDAQVQKHVSNMKLTVATQRSVSVGLSAAAWKDIVEMLDCNHTVSC